MTKLETLIQQLCPDGVEYKKLGECATMKRGVRVVKSQLSSDGQYPVYQNSMTPLGYYEQYNFPSDTTFIISAGAAGDVGYSPNKFWAADDCWCFICPENLNSKYLYYLLMKKQDYLYSRVRKASIPRLSRIDVDKIKIPVPPLPVQEEIVRILDKFTELSAELSAELTARKKQYEYYRNNLLLNTPNTEQRSLGDIGQVSMCKRILKSETSSSGDVPFYKIGTFGKKPDAFISQETFEKYKKTYSYPRKGELLISASGTIGRVVVFDGAPSYFQDSNIVWISNDEKLVLNRYLYYCYQLQPWQTATGGTISRLYNDNIRKAKIPVPSILEQERIVAILDRFDTLCNNLTSGLPAEIEARQKQYEYYRDKLLTFKEKKAE